MDGGFLYDDGRVALDEGGITLRCYYFPFGTSKRISYRDIRNVRTVPLSWWNGKGRLWGTTSPAYWYPLDMNRPRKTTLVVLDTGSWIKPAFTPDNAAEVKALIDQHVRPS